MKNYKLTSESIVTAFGVKLFRIECILDFKYAKKGEKGGFVEKEENVYGDAWVYGNARVYGDARVYGNARVYGDAWVSGDARVSGNAWKKSPLQIQGSKHYFNVCKKGFLQIGCHSFEFAYWSKNFKKIGKEEGYTKEEIKEYGLYIKLAIELYN